MGKVLQHRNVTLIGSFVLGLCIFFGLYGLYFSLTINEERQSISAFVDTIADKNGLSSSLLQLALQKF